MSNIYNWQVQDHEKRICKKLMKEGLISYSDWIVDAQYFGRETSADIRVGYGVWAAPIAKMMEKNKVLEKMISYPAQWLIEDIKFKKGLRSERHIKGLLLRQFIFNPVSWFLGKVLSKRAYKLARNIV